MNVCFEGICHLGQNIIYFQNKGEQVKLKPWIFAEGTYFKVDMWQDLSCEGGLLGEYTAMLNAARNHHFDPTCCLMLKMAHDHLVNFHVRVGIQTYISQGLVQHTNHYTTGWWVHAHITLIHVKYKGFPSSLSGNQS